MKKVIALLLLVSPLSHATTDYDQPLKKALEFNKWYVQQISKDGYPLTDSGVIDKYVTTETLKKLRGAIGNDDEYYDADFFLKAQDIGDDWPTNVSIVSSDYDPVCLNVYVSFGKDKKHTVIDCMVKEGNNWKIQSVAGQAILNNVNIK